MPSAGARRRGTGEERRSSLRSAAVTYGMGRESEWSCISADAGRDLSAVCTGYDARTRAPQLRRNWTDRPMSMPREPRAILMRSARADNAPWAQQEPQYLH